MPHQCTNCGRTFADGSKEMLSGCPECGGNKFQFRPAGASAPPAESKDALSAEKKDVSTNSTTTNRPRTESTGTSTGSTGTRADENASANEPVNPSDPTNAPNSANEDTAQAAARSGMVSQDELQANASPPEPDEEVQPGLAQLREELNEQFESIKIVEPGQYELNLMGLYDREEYIIALEENGRYVINVPDSWKD